MSTDENKEVVRQFHRAVLQNARGTLEHLGAHCTPDVKFHTPILTQEPDHLDRIHGEIDGWATAVPDVDMKIDVIVAEDDLVAVHLRAGGTHQGRLNHPEGPCEPTGAPVEAGALELFRVRSGKISEIWYYSALPGVVRAASTS